MSLNELPSDQLLLLGKFIAVLEPFLKATRSQRAARHILLRLQNQVRQELKQRNVTGYRVELTAQIIFPEHPAGPPEPPAYTESDNDDLPEAFRAFIDSLDLDAEG